MFRNDIERIMGPFYHPDGDLGILAGMPGDDKGDENDENDDKGDDKGDEDDVDDNKEDKDKDKDKDKDDKDDDGEENEDNEEDDEEEKDDNKDDDDEEEDEENDDVKVLTTWTDIKKKYPDFAKEFPDVKNALFREQSFTEVFASPAEAKEALDAVQNFNQLSDDIVGKGNIVDLLEHVKSKNKESYEKIVYSILPHLQEKDKDFYYDLAALPIKQLLRSAWAEGNGDKTDLGKAAAHIHKFFFRNLNFDEKVPLEGEKKTSTEKSKREQELEDRLAKIEDGKQRDFLVSVDDSYINKMSKHIREGLDKDDRLTEWGKAKIVEEVLKGVKVQLRKDTRYTSNLSSLLKQATSAGFTNDFKTRIVNAALVRAKSLVPDVRKKVVSEALGKKAKEKGNSEGERNDREKKPTNRSSSSNRSSSQNTKPQTDLDILRA